MPKYLLASEIVDKVLQDRDEGDEQPETLTDDELWGDSETAHEQSQSQFGDGSRYL